MDLPEPELLHVRCARRGSCFSQYPRHVSGVGEEWLGNIYSFTEIMNSGCGYGTLICHV